MTTSNHGKLELEIVCKRKLKRLNKIGEVCIMVAGLFSLQLAVVLISLWVVGG